MLGLLALDQSNMEIQPGADGELLEEPSHDVVIEASDGLSREVDVRRDKRHVGDLKRRSGERFVSRQHSPPRTARIRCTQRRGKRLTQRARTCCCPIGSRAKIGRAHV